MSEEISVRHSLVFAFGVGMVVGLLVLLHHIGVPRIYTDPIVAAIFTAAFILGCLFYFRTNEAKTRRRGIATLFSLAGLILTKLLMSPGIYFFGKLFPGMNLLLGGIAELKIESNPWVDGLLISVMAGLCCLATLLIVKGLPTLHGNNMKPDYISMDLSSVAKCREYLIEQVKSEDGGSTGTRVIQDLLHSFLTKVPDIHGESDKERAEKQLICILSICKSHHLGKSRAKQQIFIGLRSFREHYSRLRIAYGYIYTSIEEVGHQVESLSELLRSSDSFE